MKISWYSYCTSSGLEANGDVINSSDAKYYLRKVIKEISDDDALEALSDIVRSYGDIEEEYDEPCDQCGHYSEERAIEVK